MTDRERLSEVARGLLNAMTPHQSFYTSMNDVTDALLEARAEGWNAAAEWAKASFDMTETGSEARGFTMLLTLLISHCENQAAALRAQKGAAK